VKIQQLKNIIKECISECKLILENTAPGLELKTIPLDKSPDIGDIDETVDDMGARTRKISDDEIGNYMLRRKDKKPAETDKFNYPFIHGYNVEIIDIVDDSGNTIRKADVEKFKQLISKRPIRLISQNSKMEKTSGETVVFYNTSLPAFKGIIVDESTNELHVVDTCPSAGSCRVFCYAKHGSFVQWKATSLRQTQILNFLFNDWAGYKAQILSELTKIIHKDVKNDKHVSLRWNDSGDMLSDKYLEIVMDIAKATPEITHYAYTKEVQKAKEVQNIHKNFVFNFSKGALPKQDALIDVDKDKSAIVVPDILLKGTIIKDKATNKWVYTDELSAKKKIAMKYGLNINKLLTVDDISNRPMGDDKQYNVIVLPGESDISASRRDVHGTYLILH